MRDWTICFHCGARFLDAEGEAHGRTCEKSPQRKLEAALAASEARVKRLRGFLASAESLILGDETRTKTAEAWLDDARAALRLLACVPLVALVVAAIATAPIAGVMSFLIGFATVIALAAIIAAFLWGVG